MKTIPLITGLSILGVEILAIIIYGLVQLNWSWLTPGLIVIVLFGLVIGTLNLAALIMILVGVFSEDKK